MPEYVSIPEAARITGYASGYLYRCIKRGKLNAVRLQRPTPHGPERTLCISTEIIAELKGRHVEY